MISNFTLSIGLLVSAACGGLPLENGPELQRDALQNVFSSSGFAERFAESYLAENDVVPAVSADEQMVVQEVQQLLSEDSRDEAEALLKENLGLASSAVYDYLLANLYFQDDKLDLRRSRMSQRPGNGLDIARLGRTWALSKSSEVNFRKPFLRSSKSSRWGVVLPFATAFSDLLTPVKVTTFRQNQPSGWRSFWIHRPKTGRWAWRGHSLT